MNYSELLAILTPVIVLCCGGTLCLLMGASRNTRYWVPHTALVSLGVCIGLTTCTYFNWEIKPISRFSEDLSLHVTTFGYFAGVISQVIGILLVLISWNPDASSASLREKQDYPPICGEYFSMMLFSLSGLALLTAANNLIVFFLALELVSVPTYVMVTLSRPHSQAREAGLKYFFLGAMAAAITVYGFSLLYGVAGTITLNAPVGYEGTTLAKAMMGQTSPLYLPAVLIIIAGLCFKIAALPLHFYVADVYQGAASSVTALLAFVPKLAGFYGLMIVVQLFGHPLWHASLDPQVPAPGMLVGWVLWVLAAGTMTVGNVLAGYEASQAGLLGNVKRILAYSSVAHTGYMLLALLEGVRSGNPTTGMTAVLFYITVYAIATLGAFGILSLIERAGDEAQLLSDLRGLARQHPGLAAGLAICIFSLIGMPLTAGFIGKFYVFTALVGEDAIPQRIVLLVIALINAAVAAYYYLKIIAACYLEDGEWQSAVRETDTRPQHTGIVLASVLTLVLGLAPALLMKPLQEQRSLSIVPSAVQARDFRPGRDAGFTVTQATEPINAETAASQPRTVR